MIKSTFLLGIILLFTNSYIFGQYVMIGPRISGNLNIYNQKGLTGSYNGLGIGIGGTVDVSFSEHLGLMSNITFFDMRNFSNSVTQNNVSVDASYTLSYLAIEPMFKAEFSGFYMTAGPSLGVKLSSSGEITQSQAGQAPATQASNLDTKSIRFDLAFGAGYTFAVAPKIGLGTDFMVYVPVTDTYNFPGLSNSVLTLKLGASMKFRL